MVFGACGAVMSRGTPTSSRALEATKRNQISEEVVEAISYSIAHGVNQKGILKEMLGYQ